MKPALRVAVVTEIYYAGGIDTVITNLVNHWPSSEDSFVLIANASYPGLAVIETRLTRPLTVVRHDLPAFDTAWAKHRFFRVAKKIVSPIVRYLFLFYNVFALRRLLVETNADQLLVVNGGYPGGDSCRAAAIAWRTISGKPKSIHSFHNIARTPAWHSFIQETIVDRMVERCTHQFVTGSRAAAASLATRSAITCQPVIIPYGIVAPSSGAPASSSTDMRDEMGIPAEAPLCVMLATYEPRKGHYFLFQAFKKVLSEVPNAHLVVCGSGSPQEVERVKAYATELGLAGNVHVMHFRPDAMLLLASADVLLVASQVNESFGLTSVEAMARRIPVVATDVGGIPEVVVSGDGGYCVGHRDVETYASRIINLLKDTDLRKAQGELGFKRFQRLFRAETMAAGYARLVRDSVPAAPRQ